VENVTNTEAFAPAFAMSGLGGSGMTAAAMWRPTTAAATNSAVVDAAAANPAQHQTVAISSAARTRSRKLAVLQSPLQAQLHTQKQYVVTTPDAGRGNKGTSPWGFPV
jgi:hypothetical protein